MTGAKAARAVCIAAIAAGLGACSIASNDISQKSSGKFSQAKYGPASPRVVASNKPVPKGGGRYLVGKPYEVAGKVYVPTDNPNYTAVGTASWYGADFHGRLTANGEVYDVNGLTAAHPTLPLPSYARVTNLENGSSVIVRVNDRGPFHDNRIIDVSEKVAGLLDFEQSGTARVKVEYVGPAQLDGLDERKLMASYTPPGSIGSAGTFMVASASPRLSPRPLPAEAFQPTPNHAPALAPTYATGSNDPLAPLILRAGIVSSYAERPPMSAAHEAAADLAHANLNAALTAAAARRAAEIDSGAHLVQVGSFLDPANADRVASALRDLGKADVAVRQTGGRTINVVTVSSTKPDAVIAAAAGMGLQGAFVLAD